MVFIHFLTQNFLQSWLLEPFTAVSGQVHGRHLGNVSLSDNLEMTNSLMCWSLHCERTHADIGRTETQACVTLPLHLFSPKRYFPRFPHSKTNGKFVGHKNTSDPLQDRLNITWPNINLSNCATTHWSWNFNQRWSRGMTSCPSTIERINRLGKSANSSHCPYCTNVFARLNVTSVFKVVRGSGDPEVTVLIQFHWLLGLHVMKGWLIAGFTRQRSFAEGWEKNLMTSPNSTNLALNGKENNKFEEK